MKRIGILLMCGCIIATVTAQPKTVDDCITLATEHSISLKVAGETAKIARNTRSQSISNYFPHISVVGSYQWNQKNLELIDYGSMMYGMLIPAEIRHLTRIDIQNVMVADVALVQPVFLGGKLVALNKMANYGQTMAENNVKAMHDNVSLLTQENYWLVVSLAKKRELAHSMVELLTQTQTNVRHMIDEGVATPADLLNVEVRLNEVQLAESKIEQGLTMAKFNLMQLCGIDLNDTIMLADETSDTITLQTNGNLIATLDTANLYTNRTDIANLELSKKITKKQETIVRSSLLPNVLVNANYLVSNPNLYKGFDNSFGGMFNVGVSVTVPITEWIGGSYRLNSAKANTRIKDLEIQEAKDKAQLELKQATFQYSQANNTLAVAATNKSIADVNLRAAKLQFEEGLCSPLALMEAQTAWLKAHTEYIDAQIDVHISELALQKVSGQVK